MKYSVELYATDERERIVRHIKHLGDFDNLQEAIDYRYDNLGIPHERPFIYQNMFYVADEPNGLYSRLYDSKEKAKYDIENNRTFHWGDNAEIREASVILSDAGNEE